MSARFPSEGVKMRAARLASIVLIGFVAACDASDSNRTSHGRPDMGSGGGGGGGTGSGGGGSNSDGGIYEPDDGGVVVQDPKTCDEAAMNKSYIGCDYWPTVVANAVWSIFDFAVVISNPGTDAADITVTGPNSVNSMVTVMPGSVEKIYLPWVASLKGPDADAMGGATPPSASVSAKASAYHLVSTKPVLVYQFNALEYAPKGGPTGKDWTKCPGNGMGTNPPCFSYSNDASLLMPSTAMTGNYRVFSEHGLDGSPGLPPIIPASPGMPGYIAITATAAGTTVKVQVSSTGAIAAGTGITAVASGGTATYTMDAGDVLELFSNGATASDLSGSLVQADKPVQVIAGSPCIANPPGGTDAMGSPLSCDHIEETVQPAETLGRHYVVTQATGPNGNAVGQTVRLVGNVDGTNLTFAPAVSGAPSTINAGQVVELGMVNSDFEVTGDHEFIVATIQLSGGLVDPNAAGGMQKGDPSLSTATAVEQYRLKYVFLAPNDYDVNYADVVVPMGTHLTLDGTAVSQSPTQIGTGGFGVVRIKLDGTKGGGHEIDSDQPCGLQIEGYGQYTSYQYPAGLDLLVIAPPPGPIG
jgi:hypothetical protein